MHVGRHLSGVTLAREVGNNPILPCRQHWYRLQETNMSQPGLRQTQSYLCDSFVILEDSPLGRFMIPSTTLCVMTRGYMSFIGNSLSLIYDCISRFVQNRYTLGHEGNQENVKLF